MPAKAATVTVIAKPLFTLQPAGVSGTNGQKVTLTATVTAGATGSVAFYDGARVLGGGWIEGGNDLFPQSLR